MRLDDTRSNHTRNPQHFDVAYEVCTVRLCNIFACIILQYFVGALKVYGVLLAGEDTAFAPLLPDLINDVQQRGLSSEVRVTFLKTACPGLAQCLHFIEAIFLEQPRKKKGVSKCNCRRLLLLPFCCLGSAPALWIVKFFLSATLLTPNGHL